MEFDLNQVGGKRFFLNDGSGTQEAWNFGWIPPEQRTPEERLAHEAAMGSMPEFKLIGASNDEEKVFLWECWKHPDVIAATGGRVFSGFHQLTGSCFPAGVPIRMADGSEKKIEDVVKGDRVISHTGESRCVLETWRRNYTGKLVTLEIANLPSPITMTADHRVAVRRLKLKGGGEFGPLEWIYAENLESTDDLQILPAPNSSFRFGPYLLDIQSESVESFMVYDFEVDKDHSFIAGGLAVHNCVGAGGGNTVFSLAAIEVVRLKDPEEALVPFWPLPYGRSRHHAGMRGRGEGSLGSTFAQAMREDGIVPANLEGLPKFEDSDGLTLTKNIELEWSDGAAISSNWLEKARKHLVKTTAPCRSADDLREALRNYYPCSFAGDWGGLMQCPVTGNPPVLLNRRSGSWGHQQSAHGWWNHPELGEIFYIMNQWGQDTHGRCPTGAPPGGYWIKKADADYQCRKGEVFAFSQFTGFPAQKIDWRH